MKNLRNFTAHSISFYHRDDVNYVSSIRKHVVKDGSIPYLTIPSEGMLSIAYENDPVEDEEFPVPLYRKLVLRLDRIPEMGENDVLVVSVAYATYRKQTDTSMGIPLYTVNDTVYDKEGKVIGCLGLIVN